MRKKNSIREIRLQHGLSQAEVAEALGRTQAWFSVVELGKCGVDKKRDACIIAVIERLVERRRRVRKAVSLLPSPAEACADLRLERLRAPHGRNP